MWEVNLSGSSSKGFPVRMVERSRISVIGSGRTQTHFDEPSCFRRAATPI